MHSAVCSVVLIDQSPLSPRRSAYSLPTTGVHPHPPPPSPLTSPRLHPPCREFTLTQPSRQWLLTHSTGVSAFPRRPQRVDATWRIWQEPSAAAMSFCHQSLMTAEGSCPATINWWLIFIVAELDSSGEVLVLEPSIYLTVPMTSLYLTVLMTSIVLDSSGHVI